jgi:hypothetical protein
MNVGNTCYVNAALQQFLQLPVIAHLVLRTEDPTLDGYREFQTLFRQVITTKHHSVDASLFLRAWKGRQAEKIVIGTQDDSALFVRSLIDWLPQPISALFSGVTVVFPLNPSIKTDKPFFMLDCEILPVNTMLEEAFRLMTQPMKRLISALLSILVIKLMRIGFIPENGRLRKLTD